jgi:hypothetical protein
LINEQTLKKNQFKTTWSPFYEGEAYIRSLKFKNKNKQ